MTWYASHIYALPNPILLAELSAHPILSQGLYLIDEITAYPTKRADEPEHGVPEGGLLVVRELCNPANVEQILWHNGDDPILLYDTIEGPPDVKFVWPPIIPIWAFGRIDTSEGTEVSRPTFGFIRYLKDLSSRTNTPLAYYYHMTGAGYGVQQEFSWVFGPDECAYVDHVQGKQVQYLPHGKHAVLGNPGRPILAPTLRPFGFNLPTNYFAPHTRAFPWERYKLNISTG